MVIARVMNGVSLGLRRLLRPTLPAIDQTNGFKVKKFLKLRCVNCYFIRVDGRMHVECKQHPRHKQREEFNVKLLW